MEISFKLASLFLPSLRVTLLEQRRVVTRQLFRDLADDGQTAQRDRITETDCNSRRELFEQAVQEPDLARRLEEEERHFAAWLALQAAQEGAIGRAQCVARGYLEWAVTSA